MVRDTNGKGKGVLRSASVDEYTDKDGILRRSLSFESRGLVGITTGGGMVTMINLHDMTREDLRAVRDAIDIHLADGERAQAAAEVDAILAQTRPAVDEVLDQHGSEAPWPAEAGGRW